MKFVYSERTDWSLPYWFDAEVPHARDSIDVMMDINEWCTKQLGELGTNWGYERLVVTKPHPQGLNPVRIKINYTFINYSWRFKNKEDAMLFKLRWFETT